MAYAVYQFFRKEEPGVMWSGHAITRI
jgi:hypothetical protein